ncbi:MAG: SPOR domain-containing protein [Rhodothermales bacterium]|nr:SPOR domain-containing protein [Rhodothermales bacterium]
MRKILFIAILLVASTGGRAAVSEPLADSVGQGEFTLQVATYQSKADASALTARIPDAWVQEISAEGRKMYRVNFRRFQDRNAAVRAQWDLEDLGYKGFIQRLYT